MASLLIKTFSAAFWLAGLVGYVTLPDEMDVLAGLLGDWIKSFSKDDIILLFFGIGALGFFITAVLPILRRMNTYLAERFFARHLDLHNLAIECAELAREMNTFLAEKRANEPDLDISKIAEDRDHYFRVSRAYHRAAVSEFEMRFRGKALWLMEELAFRRLENSTIRFWLLNPQYNALSEIVSYFDMQAEKLEYHARRRFAGKKTHWFWRKR